MEKQKNKITDEFIAGFYSGEGYCCVSCVNKEKEYFSTQIGIHMHIRDKELLEEIRDSIGFGTVKERENRTSKSKLKSVQYRICNIEGIKVFIKRIFSKCRGHKVEQNNEFIQRLKELGKL